MSEREYPNEMQVPERFAVAVAAELEEGEQIVWVGRPGTLLRFTDLQWSRLIVLFLLALGGSVAALLTDAETQIVAAIVAAASWFLVLGGLALPGLWGLEIIQKCFCYLVTTRRVLICSRWPGRGFEVRSFTPVQLVEMACIERDDGSGELRFDGNTGNPPKFSEGFVAITRVREVERLIRESLLLQ